MELANCRLHIGNDSDVQLKAITPAEAQVLVLMHKDRAKKHPLLNLKVVGSAQSIATPAEVQEQDGTYEEDVVLVNPNDPSDKSRIVKAGVTILAGSILKAPTFKPRTAAEELSRLRKRYHKQYLDKVFPAGANSKIPDTFKDAEETWKEQPVAQSDEVVGSWTDVPGPLPKQAGPTPVTKAA